MQQIIFNFFGRDIYRYSDKYVYLLYAYMLIISQIIFDFPLFPPLKIL